MKIIMPYWTSNYVAVSKEVSLGSMPFYNNPDVAASRDPFTEWISRWTRYLIFCSESHQVCVLVIVPATALHRS